MQARVYASTKKSCFIALLTLLLLTIFLSGNVLAQDLTQYRLSSDDVISVTVFNEPDLSLKEARVSSSGTISMPLIGQVAVKGFTLTEVEREIHRMYLGDYLKKPDISVSIIEYRQFYVNGEVDKPGGFSYREGMTVERAITLAGGFTGRAAKDKIFIVRENTKGKPIAAELTTLIRPGDVITVEESFF